LRRRELLEIKNVTSGGEELKCKKVNDKKGKNGIIKYLWGEGTPSVSNYKKKKITFIKKTKT